MQNIHSEIKRYNNNDFRISFVSEAKSISLKTVLVHHQCYLKARTFFYLLIK